MRIRTTLIAAALLSLLLTACGGNSGSERSASLEEGIYERGAVESTVSGDRTFRQTVQQNTDNVLPRTINVYSDMGSELCSSAPSGWTQVSCNTDVDRDGGTAEVVYASDSGPARITQQYNLRVLSRSSLSTSVSVTLSNSTSSGSAQLSASYQHRE